MLNVALTGNVAAGKSTVVALFRRWGASVIEADALVREVQAPGTPVHAGIVRRFGRRVLAPGGGLDRAALRAVVLHDDAALRALNAIVHPAVHRRRDEMAAAAGAAGDLVLVSDIPLLFEAADPDAFDLVVLVDAPAATRRRRLRASRGLAEAEADRLMALQLPAEVKRAASDIVIDNASTVPALERAARAAWRAIRRLAARHAMTHPATRLLLVAHRPAELAQGPAGTAARYVDAGLAVHLLVRDGDRAAARQLADGLGLESVTCSTPPHPRAARRMETRVRPDAVIACGRGAALWAPDAWQFVPPTSAIAARLDVRPWRELVERVRGTPPADRETFARAARAPVSPYDDLFSSG